MCWIRQRASWIVCWLYLCLAVVGCDGNSHQAPTDGQGIDSVLCDSGNSEREATSPETSDQSRGGVPLDVTDRGELSGETDLPDWPDECDSCAANQECSNGLCVPPGMVGVPEGEFWMGCNLDHDKYCKEMLPNDKTEFPFHPVWLDSFAIDVLEVTVSAYMECVSDGHCTRPDWDKDWPYGCAGMLGGEDPAGYEPSLPITCVKWFQALGFCQWREKRLCTEAEWEKAARGPQSLVYPWGNSLPSCHHASYAHGSYSDPECPGYGIKPVGSFPLNASPYGVLDMAGNVQEWVADWFDNTYYYYTPYENPQGPSWGKWKGKRGGSYDYGEKHIRTSSRKAMPPTLEDYTWGFRCCSSL